MSAGIDSISLYTSRYFVDLSTLARARGVDPNKFSTGLGQLKMGIVPPDDDVITLAASAAFPLLTRYQPSDFDMLLFTTESGIDQSKAGAVYVRHLLGLPDSCRVVEMKQACYSSTAALQLAIPYVEMNPTRKVMIIASDIARYGLCTAGEPTQGCGAVAMVISADPKLIEIDTASGCYTEDVMDFWRPNYRREALVDGKYSTKLYLTCLDETWKRYSEKTKRSFSDHQRFCYHLPFTRMAEKAHSRLVAACGKQEQSEQDLVEQVGHSLSYNRIIGNSYTASMYVGLTSLLDNATSAGRNLADERIGFFSYGSGCTAEFFSGVVQRGYEDQLFIEQHKKLLNERTELSFADYEKFYSFLLPSDGGVYETPKYHTGPFRFAGLSRHKRLYNKVI